MLEIGSLVDGKYKILNKVGQGGMSVVYMAINEKANKTWAVKEVRKDGVLNFEAVKQGLVAETNILKKLSHPNLPSIIDVIDTEDSFIIIMDYVQGNSLNKALEEYGAQPQEYVIEWAKQLCDVLGYLHSRQPPIIYRDMKPANIMLKPDGNVTLIDFGTAREFKEKNLADTTCLGTVGYAAPEQYTSSAWQDTYTDVYAIAATIYRTLTGTMPVETLSRVANDNLVSASTLNQSIPKNVSNALTAAMQLSPEKRTQTVGELIAELSQVMDFGDGSENPQAEAPVVKEKEKDKKNGARYAAISVAISAPVLILIIVVLMLTLFPRKKPSNVSSKGLSSISVSSESSSSETSSKTRFLYAVPSFVSRNVDAIINDTDYTEKYKFKTVYDYNEEYAEGTVVEQSVEAGTPVESNGTEITLTVSRGSKWRVLPDLVGRNVDYAKDTLNDKFIRYEVETLTGTYGDPQVVAKMSKEEGTRLDISQGQTVILYVYEALPSSSSSSKPDTDWVNDLQ